MDITNVVFVLFLLVQNIHRCLNEKLYNEYDNQQIGFNIERQSSSWRRNKIRHVLREEGTGEGDKKSLDSSDLIEEGSIISEPDEETFNSGIHSINQLSKDDKADGKNSNKGKNKKHKNKETKKKVKHEQPKKVNETTNGIDLKYLQDLFQNKDIEEFQKNFTEGLKKASLDNLYKELVTNKKKVLASLRNQSNVTIGDDDSILRKLVEEERNSERYQINFPLFYHAVGTITLPYDDLVEPFEAWYAGELNMSRIDYYQGIRSTT